MIQYHNIGLLFILQQKEPLIKNRLAYQYLPKFTRGMLSNLMKQRQTILDQIPSPSSSHLKQQSHLQSPSHLSISTFLTYLKWTAIIMLSASLISIIILVLVNATYNTTSSLSNYSSLSRLFLKTTLLALYQTVQKCQPITPGYWCSYPTDSIEYFVFKPSKGKFHNIQDVNRLIANHTTQTEICYFFNTFKIKIGEVEYNAKEIRIFCYCMDGFIMFVALILLVVNQYRAEEKHREEKRYMVDKYSIKVNNLPVYPRYQLLCRIKLYIEKEVQQYLERNQICKYDFSIFDITTNLPLQKQINSKISSSSESQQNPSSQISSSNIILKRNSSYAEVWITFGSISNRKLVLNLFKNNRWYMRIASCFSSNKLSEFEGCAINVEKAPNPEDIVFSNLNVTSRSRFIIRILIYLLCMILLILSIFLLLFLKRLSSVLISSFSVLLTNALAPLILIFLTKYQRHSLITNESISKINKIAIYKYINTGLVVFLSQFKIEGLLGYFSNYFSYFTNQEYSSVTNTDWILNTGLSMVYTMLLSILISNLKILSQCIIYYLKYYKHKILSRILESKKSQQPTIPTGTIDSHELYGQIAAVTMIILSYSYLLPILYPIGFLIFFTNYLTSMKMKKYFKFPVDSFNNLTKTATSWTLIAIILHMAIVGFIEDSKVHWIIACGLSFVYLFRMFLMRLFVGIINDRLRGEKLKKQGKENMQNKQEFKFWEILTDRQRWIARGILKARRDEIKKHAIKNPKLYHTYSHIFKTFLLHQRDLIKSTSKPISQQPCNKIIGLVTYYN